MQNKSEISVKDYQRTQDNQIETYEENIAKNNEEITKLKSKNSGISSYTLLYRASEYYSNIQKITELQDQVILDYKQMTSLLKSYNQTLTDLHKESQLAQTNSNTPC